MRRQLRRSFHQVQRQNLQKRTSNHRWQTQRHQRPLEHPTGAESEPTTNNSKHFATLSKWCPPTHRNKTRPSNFPPCLCFQPTAINVPTSNSTRSFQHRARPHRVTYNKAPPQITRHQQRPPTHATEKHPVNQANRRPSPCHVA